MKRNLLSLLVLLLCCASTMLAQRTITGTVINADDNNTPVPFANVIVKGAVPPLGVTTDVDGHFSINVPAGFNVLTVSYTGLESKDVNIDGLTTIDVVLRSTATELETVVVTGYGVTKKAAFTGAATRVGEDVVTRQSGANVISNLQGSIPGAQIDITSGSPGASSSIQIRGLGSVNAGSAPLFIIDGIPVVTGNFSTAGDQSVDPLSALNPNDIENISLLKDASATAIYGARASNGVVVITTKQGSAGKSTINFNMKVGQNQKPRIRRNYSMLDVDDYVDYLTTALINDGTAESAIPGQLERWGIDPDISNPTDWFDEITFPGWIQEYALSASGGNENNKYFVSGSYFEDEGFVIGGGTKRFTIRLNLDNKLNKYFTIGNMLSGSYSATQGIGGASDGGVYYSNPIFSSRKNTAFEPVKNDNGEWNFATSTNDNPVARYSDPEYNPTTNLYKLNYSPFIRLNPIKDLFIQTKAGIDYTLSHGVEYGNPLTNMDAKNFNGWNIDYRYQTYTLINTNTINWMPTWGKHALNVLLGQEVQATVNSYNYTMYTQFADYRLIKSGATAAGIFGAQQSSSSATLASFFSNVEYAYNDKYYASLALRRDGSSRFIGKNQWGNFFAVGAKYRITQEEFMKPTADWLQNLSLRASYGTTGNQDVGYYAAHGLYSFAGLAYNGLPGSAQAQLPNDALTWETRKKFNIGLDAALLNRIGIEFDFFSDIVDDMLFLAPVTGVSGFTSITRNVGSMRNQGVEAMVNVLAVNHKNFRLTLNANITAYKNTMLELAEDTILTNGLIRTSGLPWNTFCFRNFGGIDVNTGRPYWILADGSYTTDYSLANQIENRILAGDAYPQCFGGFGAKIESFGFDLSCQFVYNLGGYSMNDAGLSMGEEAPQSHNNGTYYWWDNAWKKPGDVASLPRVSISPDANWAIALMSKQHLNSNSYLKVRNITLGYTIPKQYLKKLMMSNVRLYVSCDNPYSWYPASYRGFDTNPSGLAQENYGFNYPVASSVVFGLNVTF